jgi:uncharacterized protein YndB with AHSA1/START domain
MEKEIKQTWFFRQSPQEVWAYLTNPELIEQWLSKTDFQPVVGHQFHFISPYGNHSVCEVLEVHPFTRLAYSWQKKSAKNNIAFTSIVVWTLVPKENGTELQLLHNGFTAWEDVAAHENGWNICFNQFEKLIEGNHSPLTIHHSRS